MNIIIPDEVLQMAQLTPADLKREVALLLLQRQALQVDQATQLAEMHPLEFEQLLVQRHISAPLRFKKLSALQTREAIVGDPEELVHFDWTQTWNH
jgi:predicted HTH domain antitoxin